MWRPTIFCDLDGVLADFCGAALDLFEANATPADVTHYDALPVLCGLTEHAFWRELERRGGSDFWADLPPYYWAGDLVDYLRRAGDVHLISTPPPGLGGEHGKAIWCRRYFPGLRLWLVPEGQRHLLSRPGRVLVDDCPANVQTWRRFPHYGTAVLFGQPWNGGAEGDWGGVVQRVIDATGQGGARGHMD